MKKTIQQTNADSIENPILRGFNPDPSILRVGEDFYIATSTFQWFPGVQIHHSKDLKNWRLLTRPLSKVSQLDMTGVPASGGIWAPCLSYSRGTFYLIYTIVHSLNSIFKDTHNYLVTTGDIMGPWSDPVYLNSSGFDPSLFHDDDGRKWLLNMIWDHRPRMQNFFGGILLQEYSEAEKKLTGPVVNIFKGTVLGITEGPHLYKRGGFYYLLTAEGGTECNHAVTMARSKNIEGPYEVDPENPVLTSRYNSSLPLQRAGHGDFLELPSGEIYMAHLCGRPHKTNNRCILGRETALQKMVWTEDGWLRPEQGGHEPVEKIPAPSLPEHPWPAEPMRDDFNSGSLNIHFQTLRAPLGHHLSLTERPGFLRLKGGESLYSLYNQVLVARRQQSFCFRATTGVEFHPHTFQQSAGLIHYYSHKKFHYFYISHDETEGKVLEILSNIEGEFSQPLKKPIKAIEGQIFLRAEVNYSLLRFFYSWNAQLWYDTGVELDASVLSDEYGTDFGFTGAFIGLCCQDLSGSALHADFDFFEYS